MPMINCLQCGKERYCYPVNVSPTGRNFCSRECHHIASGARKPLEVKFWERVNKESSYIASNMETECWEWMGSTTSGYGTFRTPYPGMTIYAHRFSYKLNRGEIPEGLFVCHKCDNRKCVRPDHLFLGTAQDNMDDAKAKGRTRTAWSQTAVDSSRKLSMGEADQLRDLYTRGVSATKLARQFNIHRSNVYRIVNKETYAK